MPQPSAVSYEPEECAWCMGRGREREQKCEVCKGRGAVLAAQPARPCRSCAGTGREGLIEARRACQSCGGAGWDGAQGCPCEPAAVGGLAPRGRKRERRDSPRAPLLLPVTWGRTGERPREAETGDLSLGGCFVMTTDRATVGERVMLTLPCQATAGLRLSGEIAYRIEIGFGVRFARMPEAARASLTLLLADYYRRLEGAGRPALRAESV
jgi:PilZ domain-containing protein